MGVITETGDILITPRQDNHVSRKRVSSSGLNVLCRLWNCGTVAAFIVLIMLLALSATPAGAAPLHPAIKLVFIPGFKLLDMAVATSVTMLMLRGYGLRVARVAPALIASAITCNTLLFPIILPAFKGDMVPGMACVILLETAALFIISNLDWFRHDGEAKELLIRTILLAGFCGNAVSLFFGIYVMWPLQMWLLQLLIHRS